MNIAVLYNKPTERFIKDTTHKDAEEDTEESAHEIVAALKTKGVEAILFPITEHTIDSIMNIRADLVFNLIEWTGIDTKYAMAAFDVLNTYQLHYTGATKENYHDTCDKIITKRLCKTYDLPTADWQEFETGNETITITDYPLIVKVSNEHSSVGITKDAIAHNSVELKAVVKKSIGTFHQSVFAETFLSGREFQVTLLEKADGLAVLPPAEIVYTKGTDVPLLTYESRWNARHSDYKNSSVVLAKDIPPALISMCKSAFLKFGFRDYARFDLRCDKDGHPFFLELNSNPGLGDDPDYGMTVSYRAAGMNFPDFVWEIVQSALRRSLNPRG